MEYQIPQNNRLFYGSYDFRVNIKDYPNLFVKIVELTFKNSIITNKFFQTINILDR